MLNSPWLALLVTLVAAITWLAFCAWVSKNQYVSSKLSRKLVHIGTGPIFVLCWLLFPDLPISRYLAALLPLPITIQYLLVGLGVIDREADVNALSRSGDRRELLKGPFYYGIVFVLITLLVWKDHPAGVTALMVLCGGDGLADPIGNLVKSKPLFWSPRKTWAGSLGMLLGGLVFSAAVLAVYTSAGVFAGPLTAYLPGLVLVSLGATLVESLPVSGLDNLTVPAAALLLGFALLG